MRLSPRLVFLITVLTVLPLSGYGAGMDCTKVNTETEKLICLLNQPYSPELSEKVFSILPSADEVDANLLDAFTQGIDQTTEKVSCDLFKNHTKEAVEIFSTHFGGTRDGAISLCPDALSDAVPELKQLIEQSKSFSRSYRGQPCTGTVAISIIREVNVDDVLAQYAPLERADEKEFKALSYTIEPEMLVEPLKGWAWSGAWERLKYRQMLKNAIPAYKAVMAYYRKEGRFKEDDISTYAAYSVMNLTRGYAIETLDPLDGKTPELSIEFDPPLMMAVSLENLDKVKTLLHDKGASVNEQNILGETALIIAIQANNAPIVQTLLQAGANPNLGLIGQKEDNDIEYRACERPVDYNGLSPLQIAVRYGASSEIIKILLDAGATPTGPDALQEDLKLRPNSPPEENNKIANLLKEAIALKAKIY